MFTHSLENYLVSETFNPFNGLLILKEQNDVSAFSKRDSSPTFVKNAMKLLLKKKKTKEKFVLPGPAIHYFLKLLDMGQRKQINFQLFFHPFLFLLFFWFLENDITNILIKIFCIHQPFNNHSLK